VPIPLVNQRGYRLSIQIIQICGFNVAIIAGLFSLAATRLLGRRYGLWVAIVAIAVYTLLVAQDLRSSAPPSWAASRSWPTRSGGSERATGLAWVDALDLRLALISVDAQHGPAQAILDRLAARCCAQT